MEAETLIIAFSKSGRTAAPEPTTMVHSPSVCHGTKRCSNFDSVRWLVSRSFKDALDSLAYFGGWVAQGDFHPWTGLWLGFAGDLERDDPNSLRRL